MVRVWMMMVDAVVLDLSFKACKYGGALLGFFITRTYVYLCLLRVQSSRSILLMREVRFRTGEDKVHWATFTTFTWISCRHKQHILHTWTCSKDAFVYVNILLHICLMCLNNSINPKGENYIFRLTKRVYFSFYSCYIFIFVCETWLKWFQFIHWDLCKTRNLLVL